MIKDTDKDIEKERAQFQAEKAKLEVKLEDAKTQGQREIEVYKKKQVTCPYPKP